VVVVDVGERSGGRRLSLRNRGHSRGRIR
jgi:hypothetical protein